MEFHRIRTRKSNLELKYAHGHFVTNHSHTNYYIDITTLKTRLKEAEAVARELVTHYRSSTIVDTILCLDDTQVIGACVAKELTSAGFMSLNAHETIYVLTPEYNSNSQLIFRDNTMPMIRGKNVLILMASVSSGITLHKSMECVQYYGGKVAGLSAIYSSTNEVDGIPVVSVFNQDELPDYHSYNYHDCPFCRQGIKIDALVNGFGYSKMG
ncbi:orotate phosphoribosyltransferase [Gemmiger sp. An120]|uniref:orotate phosphoribosyltransferase n=1 Tax=Gemmiger sp. An120 TaxID=1965549 RepID=UPI000B38D214|nr:orotate phosphoribosyltransferase [Gemmiger sp. An120]OUQ40991.1 orotate phosphoribosyltransferase [Gemmiger sp. An120]HIX34042.1 orotate phosphoribosyltransferase [Candidatus Gemmiger avium]